MIQQLKKYLVICSKKVFPIVSWSREYNTEIAISDLVAGITVALTLVPQSIAYASLAGLPPQYGLYSSIGGTLVYIVFGTVPQINIGPTALISLLTFTYTHQTNVDFAILLCLLGGLVEILIGLCRLGFLVDYISLPVVSGFTSASAFIIVCAQLKGLLGLKFQSENIIETWEKISEQIHKVRLGDTLLSVSCCIILLVLRKLYTLNMFDKKPFLKKALWFISVGKNAAIVVLCAVLAYLLSINNETPFLITGEIVAGIPMVGLPNFSTTVRNETYTFVEMCNNLGSGIIVLPLIAIIANVAIAKAYSKGKVLDANQEVIALGFANVVNSFFQSFPVNGSFTRSAVSNTSGVRTPAAGLYTAAIVLMTLSFLTPYFYYIPKATLAAVIVCSVMFMIDLEIFKDLWNSNRIDLIPLTVTFIACLFVGVEMGLLVGIGMDVLILLYFSSRPKLYEKSIKISDTDTYTLITPSSGLFFPSVNYIRKCLNEVPNVVTNKTQPLIVLNCEYLQRIDWTSLQGMKSILDDYNKTDKIIMFLNCKPALQEKISNVFGKAFIHCSSESEIIEHYKATRQTSETEGIMELHIDNNKNIAQTQF